MLPVRRDRRDDRLRDHYFPALEHYARSKLKSTRSQSGDLPASPDSAATDSKKEPDPTIHKNTVWTAPKPGDVVTVEIGKSAAMQFCWVPPGKATLGSPLGEGGRDARESEHEYVSKGFWLGKFPVTQHEWEAVMKENPSAFVHTNSKIKADGIKHTLRFPVENVSWNDCQKFLTKLNMTAEAPAAMGHGRFTLPHENEWEYACRGGKGNKRPFYFGDALNGMMANCRGDHPYGTSTSGPFLGRTSKVGDYEKIARIPGACATCMEMCVSWGREDEPRRRPTIETLLAEYQLV